MHQGCRHNRLFRDGLLQRLPQLIQRRMLTANGKAAGDTLIRQVEILTANSR